MYRFGIKIKYIVLVVVLFDNELLHFTCFEIVSWPKIKEMSPIPSVYHFIFRHILIICVLGLKAYYLHTCEWEETNLYGPAYKRLPVPT